nr:hypothetical protein [Parvibaculum sp.]
MLDKIRVGAKTQPVFALCQPRFHDRFKPPLCRVERGGVDLMRLGIGKQGRHVPRHGAVRMPVVVVKLFRGQIRSARNEAEYLDHAAIPSLRMRQPTRAALPEWRFFAANT